MVNPSNFSMSRSDFVFTLLFCVAVMLAVCLLAGCKALPCYNEGDPAWKKVLIIAGPGH